MPNHSLNVRISELDTERFGIQTARAFLAPDTFDAVYKFCKEQSIKLLIARCPVSEVNFVHKLDNHGFLLMDTLVYYSRDLVRKSIPDIWNLVIIRPVKPGEADRVKKLAMRSFAGYIGHYHNDDRLARNLCDEIYPDWAYRSCISKDIADEVFIAEQENTVVGFITLRMNNLMESEGVLNGVLPAAEKQGIYTSLVAHGMMWSIRQGAEAMVISTQIANTAPQKVWTRLGFEFSHAYYTFHKWFDD
jgi:hypothetical protein